MRIYLSLTLLLWTLFILCEVSSAQNRYVNQRTRMRYIPRSTAGRMRLLRLRSRRPSYRNSIRFRSHGRSPNINVIRANSSPRRQIAKATNLRKNTKVTNNNIKQTIILAKTANIMSPVHGSQNNGPSALVNKGRGSIQSSRTTGNRGRGMTRASTRVSIPFHGSKGRGRGNTISGSVGGHSTHPSFRNSNGQSGSTIHGSSHHNNHAGQSLGNNLHRNSNLLSHIGLSGGNRAHGIHDRIFSGAGRSSRNLGNHGVHNSPHHSGHPGGNHGMNSLGINQNGQLHSVLNHIGNHGSNHGANILGTNQGGQMNSGLSHHSNGNPSNVDLLSQLLAGHGSTNHGAHTGVTVNPFNIVSGATSSSVLDQMLLNSIIQQSGLESLALNSLLSQSGLNPASLDLSTLLSGNQQLSTTGGVGSAFVTPPTIPQQPVVIRSNGGQLKIGLKNDPKTGQSNLIIDTAAAALASQMMSEVEGPELP